MKTNTPTIKLVSAAIAMAVSIVWTSHEAKAAPPVLTSVFDGTDLNGWTQNPSDTFTVNAADASIETTGNTRGFMYTDSKYTSYRVLYSVRQLVWLHWPTVLMFGYSTTADAMDGIQFQLPEDYGWDYRPGHNDAINATTYGKPSGIQNTGVWYRCEILVNSNTHNANSAAAVLGSPAVHVMSYTDSTLTTTPCPFALQAHQSGVKDEYKDIYIEVNPPLNELVTLVLPAPSNLTATAGSSGQVNLSWTINSSTQTGFEVFHSVDKVNWSLVATTAANATSYSDTGLSGSTTYYYRVAAVMSNAISDYATASATTAAGSSLANGTYKIINRNSGLALDVAGGVTTSGSDVDQYTYQGKSWQQWTVTKLSGGAYEITGVGSGKALDVAGASVANGAAVDIYPYKGSSNQQWVISPTSGGYMTVTGVQSGKLLDVKGASTAVEAPIDIWQNNGGANQQWAFQAP
jgi:hypothetical protein